MNIRIYFNIIISLLIMLIVFSPLVHNKDKIQSDNVYSYEYFNLAKMETTLNYYNDILNNDSWGIIPEDKELSLEDSGTTVSLIKQRLIKTKDLKKDNINDKYLFDDELKKAVSKFQFRHGLEVTGIVNKKTLQELNISLENRIQQIETNLNSIKKYANKLNDKYIIVNIPDFKLHVVNNHEKIMNMKVIVGSKGSPTPVLSSKITYLVLNPDWIIPYNSSIVRILPKIKNDPTYIEENDIKVFRGWGENSVEINPSTINWANVTANNLIYSFIQEPGPTNPMGLVKFKFPNNQNISLHDSPDKHFFNEKSRAFSLGCIRVEEPIKLAKYVLEDMSSMKNKNVMDIIESAETTVINLEKPIPIFLVYWTAWVTKDGILHFRNNIYNKENY